MLKEYTTPLLLKDLGMEFPTEKSNKKSRYGLYKCFCGNEFKSIVYNVNSKDTISCGCYRDSNRKKHEKTNTKIYKKWASIIQRCTNKKNNRYKDWGGRGIDICDEWKNNFITFHDWSLGNGYAEGLSIDRIDNNGNYEPSNCRWVSLNTQAQNTRVLKSNNTSGYRGVSFHKQSCKFLASIKINKKQKHLGSYYNAIDAAKAYDKYILDNNLEHTINGVLLNDN